MRIPPALALVTTAQITILLSSVALVTPALPAQTPRDLSGYLPADTPLVVDLFDGAACVRAALDLVEPLPKGIPAAARVFLMGLPLITKAATGMDAVDLLEVAAPGQALFAMGIGEGGKLFPVILSRVTETGEVERLLRRYAKGGKLHASLDEGVLTLSNTSAHVRDVLRFRGSGEPTLLADENYRHGRAELKSGRSLRFYLNIEVLRGRHAKDKSYWDQLDDGARFLIGPLVRVFDLANRVDGRLEITARGLDLVGRADADLGQDPRDVGKLEAAGAKGRRIPVLPSSALACVALDRDVGELLGHPDRWLGDDGALGVKSFLSIADQILGGASLVKDLLPNVDMPLNFFVTESSPDEDADLPRIKLPSFALVFGVGGDDHAVERLLHRAMGTVTSIANVNRLRAKKTPMSVRNGRRGEYRYKQVRFSDWNGPGDPPTEQGLSPTILFAHGHGIIASTVDGAVRLAESLKNGKTMAVRGDYIALRGNSIARVLDDNLSILTIDRVLKEGGTRQDAEVFWNGVDALVRSLAFEGHVEPRTGTTRFEFGLTRTREAK